MPSVFSGFIGHNKLIKIGKISVIMSTLLVSFKVNWKRKKKLKRGKGKQNIKLLNRLERAGSV